MASSFEQANSMNKKLLIVTVFAIYAIGYTAVYSSTGMAYAQYMGNVGGQGETGKFTLEEALELQRRRIEAVNADPQAGSGTPVLGADGVFGASAISAAIFGGIAAAFFFKGRQGKYAAQGRG